MMPEVPHSNVRSQAELRLFELIRDEPGTDDWVCIHSLGLARHSAKRRGEIDFVLITPQAILVLEVKGGRVERRGGYWIHTDRYGRAHQKGESPFDQASSAMFALERDLRDRFGRGSRMATVLLGFGVMLPDVEFDALGSEADRALVYDRRDRALPLARWVRKLIEWTRSRQSASRNGLTRSELENVVDYLRGDFALLPAFDVVADDVNRGLLRLTRQQAMVMSQLDLNPRVVIKGAAGTGKSMVALEALRREGIDGRRVLLLCYNRLLAAKLRVAASGLPNAVVGHAHDFMRQLIEKSPVSADFEKACLSETDRQRVYGKLFPEFAALAMTTQTFDPFDVIVVDEAQDLLDGAFIDLLDVALRGGVRDGRWRILLDVNEQAAIYGRLDEAVLRHLEGLGVTTILSLNCRNTTQIHLATRAIAQPRSAAFAPHPGEHVERRWYENDEGMTKQLRAVMAELRGQGVGPGSITVVYPRLADNLARTLDDLSVKALRVDDVPALGSRALTDATHATVSAFKGLENDVIVLVGIENVDDDWWRATTYVGMSRARVRLYVLAHHAVRATVDERFAAMLRETMEEAN